MQYVIDGTHGVIGCPAEAPARDYFRSYLCIGAGFASSRPDDARGDSSSSQGIILAHDQQHGEYIQIDR